jgi:hypothetical protein
VDAAPRRRLLTGLAGFIALEGAVFIRYTNVIELLVALIGVLALARSVQLAWRTIGIWMSSVVLFALGVLAFDQWAYASATSTGYSPGEITFSLSALWPNLKGMPKQLTTSMPFWILAAIACGLIAVRFIGARASGTLDHARRIARRDAAVGLVLAVGWLGLWALYLTYTWTVNQVGGATLGGGAPAGAGPGGAVTVHVIRFYLPALGLIALLGAWLLARLGRYLPGVLLAGVVVAAVLSFHSMSSAGSVGAGPNGGFAHARTQYVPRGAGGLSTPPPRRTGSGAKPPRGSGPVLGPPPSSSGSAG